MSAAHDHQHGHGHPHGHGPMDFGRAFAVGIALNLAFVSVEAFYGWRAGSLALLADAAHNLGDVGGLALAWAGLAAAKLKGNDRHTFGWRRGSILASFANALILLVAMGFLAWEAAHRLGTPSPVAGTTVIVVASVGIVINAATAWLFLRGGQKDLNLRGAFLHMAADALVPAGVVLAGLLYLWKGWRWLDPVIGLAIAGVVVAGTWSLFRRSLHLLFDGVPDDIALDEVRQCLLGLDGAVAVHDLHVWAMATSENALTAHVVLAEGATGGDAFIALAVATLEERFALRHVTLQLETAAYAAKCPANAPVCTTPA